MVEGDAQAQTSAHRVADVDAVTALLREVCRGGGKVEREVRSRAVTRGVERALFEAIIEQPVERTPAPVRLREPVHENNPIRHGDNRRLAG